MKYIFIRVLDNITRTLRNRILLLFLEEKNVASRKLMLYLGLDNTKLNQFLIKRNDELIVYIFCVIYININEDSILYSPSCCRST